MTAKILIELSKVFQESLLLFEVCSMISPENSRFSLNNWITLKAKMWCDGALPQIFVKQEGGTTARPTAT